MIVTYAPDEDDGEAMVVVDVFVAATKGFSIVIVIIAISKKFIAMSFPDDDDSEVVVVRSCYQIKIFLY